MEVVNNRISLQEIKGYTLRDLTKINVILGKNGCGKSTLLRQTEEGIRAQGNAYGRSKYITPERGGALVYQADVEQNMIQNLNWLSGQRQRNQASQFRQQSVAQYRKLETLVLRGIEKKERQNLSYTFDQYISQINALLDNIELRRVEDDMTFKLYHKISGQPLKPDDISSGESELISLAIECMIFCQECQPDKDNFLFLDEPDVHLHPDLQVRLIRFLRDVSAHYRARIVIATHSTAVLGALESFESISLTFMRFGDKILEFKAIDERYRKMLPVFGAHPLSNVFNEAPLFLVEGEDDEQIWQRAIRSSNGKIRIFPVSVEGKENLIKYETIAGEVIQAIYDAARAYSVRDGDGNHVDIDDLPPVIRTRLNCNSIENLLLTDEVLELLEISWMELETKIKKWLEVFTDHIHFEKMKAFSAECFPRREFPIKEIRNDLMGIIGSNKPWQSAIGSTIGRLLCNDILPSTTEHSVLNYLGEKLVKILRGSENQA